MTVASAAVDLVEIASVFLLAVEAIKLQNLAWLRNRALAPLLTRINPQIEYVDDFPPSTPFSQRYALEFSFLGIYVVGLTLSGLSLQALASKYPMTPPHSVAAWSATLLAATCGPFIVGVVAYSAAVWAIGRILKALAWVEAHTQSGAVGILGLSLYLIQFAARRKLAL
ncbi:hypothetical protein ACVWWW_000196 [Lysobacter sp. HA18]